MSRNGMSFWAWVMVAAVMVGAAPARAALVLQLKASGYNPATGIWVDTSGQNNNAAQATAANRPTLVAGQTPNGSAVVRFDGVGDANGDFLTLTNAISRLTDADGFTVFAAVRPANGQVSTVFSGSQDSLQYRLDTDVRQQLVKTYTANVGKGTNPLVLGAFSLIDATINDAAGAFRLNGAADGTTGGSTFPVPITTIGRNAKGGDAAPEAFAGDIAEIRIYNTQLTGAQVAAVELELANAYAPEPGSIGLIGAAGAAMLARRRRRA